LENKISASILSNELNNSVKVRKDLLHADGHAVAYERRLKLNAAKKKKLFIRGRI